MKKILLYAVLLSGIYACKKSSTDTPTPAAAPSMNVKVTSSQLFSYNITEVDTVSNDFATTDGYDLTTLDYTFTPTAGHKITIEAVSSANAVMTATVSYNSKALTPVTPIKDSSHTTITYNFTVPK